MKLPKSISSVEKKLWRYKKLIGFIKYANCADTADGNLSIVPPGFGSWIA